MQILESERLRFRRLVPGDLDDLYALYRDPEMMRWIPEGTLTREQTREQLEFYLDGHPKNPAWGLWATILKSSGAFVGRCGLLHWTIEGREEVEVAFMIGREHWRRGLGSEAAAAIARHAFEQLRLARVVCLITPGNEASRGVALRIGMRHERDFTDEFGPAWLYVKANPLAT